MLSGRGLIVQAGALCLGVTFRHDITHWDYSQDRTRPTITNWMVSLGLWVNEIKYRLNLIHLNYAQTWSVGYSILLFSDEAPFLLLKILLFLQE